MFLNDSDIYCYHWNEGIFLKYGTCSFSWQHKLRNLFSGTTWIIDCYYTLSDNFDVFGYGFSFWRAWLPSSVGNWSSLSKYRDLYHQSQDVESLKEFFFISKMVCWENLSIAEKWSLWSINNTAYSFLKLFSVSCQHVNFKKSKGS